MSTATTASSTTTTTTTTSMMNTDHLVGSKLRQKHMSNFREHVSAPTSAFAKKQLEKMGWSEGTGLGKKRNGITTHIKVKKRKDQLGLGGDEKPAVETVLGQSEWWKDSLGGTLAKLSSSSSKRGKKKKKKSSSSSSKEQKQHKQYTDEELFEATGGVRFGTKAHPTRKNHKWTRAEKDSTSISTMSGANSTSENELIVKDQKKSSKKRKLLEKDDEEETNKQKDSNESDNNNSIDKKASKKEKKKKRKTKESTDMAEDKDTESAIQETEKERKEKKKDKKDKKKTKKSKIES